MDLHLAGAVLLGTVALDDVGPQHARGAQLGDLQEVVRADRHREAQLAGGEVRIDAGVGQAGQIVVTGRKGEGELLDDRRTRVSEDVARNVDDADVLPGAALLHERRDACEALFAAGRAEVALLRQALHERVDAERDPGVAPGDAVGREFREHELGQVGHLRTAEGDGYGRNRDAGEQHVEIGGREVLLHDREAQRIDALVEDVERLGIGGRGIGDLDGLVDAPAVMRARTADVGELTRLRAQESDAFEILGAVVGTDVEPLARAPYQFALVIGTFQVGCDHLLPRLGRDRRELGEQLFTFGICHNYLVISNKWSWFSRLQRACKDINNSVKQSKKLLIK